MIVRMVDLAVHFLSELKHLKIKFDNGLIRRLSRWATYNI